MTVISANSSTAYVSKPNILVPDAAGEAANVLTRATARFADLPGLHTMSGAAPSTNGETTRQVAAPQD